MRTANNPSEADYYQDVYDSYSDPPAAPAYRAHDTHRQAPPRNGLPRGPGPALRGSPSSSFDEKPSYDEFDRQPSRRQADYDQPAMEMGPLSTKNPPRHHRAPNDSKGPREVSSTEEFFESISNLQVDLKELQHMINEMADLSQRSLDTSSDSDREAIQDEIHRMGDDIRSLSAQLKQSIQAFEADHSLLRQRGDPEGNLSIRVDQLAALKKRFIESVQRYAEVEQAARRSVKARIERQVKIVRPDASPDEVRAAVEDQINGGGAVFQQALASSNRMGSARNALREVQSRAEDIKRIEQTITELAQMFNDMATMVEEQDVKVQHIEKQAETVHQDVEAATTELKTAVASAQGARSKRKCCCVIILILILVIGGGGTAYALYKTGVIGGPPKDSTHTNGSSSGSSTYPSPTPPATSSPTPSSSKTPT